MHRDYVKLAIETLELPTSIVITNWVNDKIRSKIENKFNSAEYLLKSRKELDELKAQELKDLLIGQRRVVQILSELRVEGFASNNKYYEYSLTEIETKDSPPLSKLYEQILPKLKEQLKNQVYTTAYLGNGQWIGAPVSRQGSPIIFCSPPPTVSRRN